MTRTSIERLADCAPVASPESWVSRNPSGFGRAYDAAIEAMERQAALTARRTIKWRARGYALRPRDLDAICCGLSGLSPSKLVGMIASISYLRLRYSGFGAEVPALNLAGAILYARYLRAKECQGKKRAA